MDRRAFLVTPAMAAAGGAALGATPPTRTARPPEAVADTSGAWVEVDLGRIAFNLEGVRKRAKGRRIMAVVKANAYGHGLPEVWRFLEQKGIDAFLVNAYREAVALREAGVRGLVLNFGPIPSALRGDLAR